MRHFFQATQIRRHTLFEEVAVYLYAIVAIFFDLFFRRRDGIAAAIRVFVLRRENAMLFAIFFFFISAVAMLPPSRAIAASRCHAFAVYFALDCCRYAMFVYAPAIFD